MSALGAGFGRLWAAAIGSNLADGIARLAIPLAAVSLTTDPLAIAVLTALVYVPWLVFGIPSGMIVDRFDRRVAMAVASAIRVVAAAGVALAIAVDALSLPVLVAAVLVFGMGETLFDNATNAVLPSLVKRSGLDRANGRIQAAQVGVDSFVATPVSGVLFSLAVALPMIVSGAGYLVAAALVLMLPAAAARASRLHASGSAVDAVDAGPETRVPLSAALSFLWRHQYLRAMVATTAVMGGLMAFAQSVTVLLFIERFGVSEALLGVVTAGIGLGGVAGALTAGAVVARLGRGRTMLAAAALGGIGLLAVGLAPSVWLAIAAYGLGAYGVAMWNVPWGSLKQAIVPGHLLGRVTATARTVTWGLMPIATVLGGVVARADLQLPYIVGGAGCVMVAVVAARLLLAADAHMPVEEDPELDDAPVAVDGGGSAPEEALTPARP